MEFVVQNAILSPISVFCRKTESVIISFFCSKIIKMTTTISTSGTPSVSNHSAEFNKRSTPVEEGVEEGGGETSPRRPSRGVAFHASVSNVGGDDRSTKTGATASISYEARAKQEGMKYTLNDIPSLPVCILLGLQHYFTFLGATVLIPLLICPLMGASEKQTSEVIGTVLFCTGINTLVQTTLGTRLPIVQGGSFAFLTPVFSIIASPELQAIEDDDERFHKTMRTIQGAILVSGIVQSLLGYSGVMVPLFQYISPVTITGVITVIGLSLYNVAFNNLATCFSIGMIELFLIILFSQYLKHIKLCGYPVFSLFPVIGAIGITWIYAAIMTAADVWDEGSACRTDATRDLLKEADWFYIPLPGQWGAPIFKASAIIPMLGAMCAGMIESIGDYYSCARLSGAPPPTPGIIRYDFETEKDTC
jgi:solute carrier family 23 (nucleobase transporter), member 1